MVGTTLGHYQIQEQIGQGGMGVVYKARDTHLDRFVAIKLLPPASTLDAERLRRFILEAKAASALSHSSIVTIHDIDQEHGTWNAPPSFAVARDGTRVLWHQADHLDADLMLVENFG